MTSLEVALATVAAILAGGTILVVGGLGSLAFLLAGLMGSADATAAEVLDGWAPAIGAAMLAIIACLLIMVRQLWLALILSVGGAVTLAHALGWIST